MSAADASITGLNTAELTLPVKHQASETGLQRHGSVAVWVLIYAELTEFAFFFIVFLATRHFYPAEFASGPAQLNTAAGLANALVLISSSWFVAMSLHSLRLGFIARCSYWLLAAIAAGLVYCGIKYWEYQWNTAQGLTLQTSYFFTLYYYLAFNHLLHVLAGIVVLCGCLLSVSMGWATTENHEGLEGGINYWHMVDLAWIVLFPLLYLLT